MMIPATSIAQDPMESRTDLSKDFAAIFEKIANELDAITEKHSIVTDEDKKLIEVFRQVSKDEENPCKLKARRAEAESALYCDRLNRVSGWNDGSRICNGYMAGLGVYNRCMKHFADN